MRHEELEKHGSFDLVDVASVWPNGADTGHVPLSEIQASIPPRTTAAPDVPVAAGGLMAGTYGALLAAFPLLITHDRSSAFAIVIGAFYLLMFFAVPAMFFGIENDTTRRPELSTFLERGMQTATGHISGKGALVQMLVVPVLLTFAVVAIGLLYILL
jgi:hypothetical protein